MTLPPEAKTLGHAIRWARKQKGFDVGYLAELVGIGKAALQNIEYGSTRAGPETIGRLEKMLNVSLQGLPQQRVKLTGELSEQNRPGHGAGVPGRNMRRRAIEGRQKQDLCPTCFNLAHRRPRVGRCWCGGRFAEETSAPAEARIGSPAAMCGDAA